MKQKKAAARARKGKVIKQVGALPFRRTAGGEIELMLITSRGTQRFVFPKGWSMKDRSASAAAATEAEEEAGVRGIAADAPIGEYRYWKRMKSAFVPVTVSVFPIEVTQVLSTWRESADRQRRWVSWDEARLLVDEPHLVSLIDSFFGNNETASDPLPD